MKRLLSLWFAAGILLGSGVIASAAWVSSLSGPQDLSQTWFLLNQQLTNYVSYVQPGEVGSASYSPSVCVSGTSLCVYMPNGALRYIQTSATP